MASSNPKVSIVIPVYNGSNYLGEAIDSALAQTYKNIEIIVVNDGSKDRGATEKIAKSYGNKIRYFKKENGGVSTALNLGIEKMTGEYFSWLSHDDMYYPNKIERQVEYLRQCENKNIVLFSNYALLKDKKIIPVELDHELTTRKPLYALLRGFVNGITLLIPKKMFDDVGVFNTKLKCTQDYDLWLRAIRIYGFVHMQDIISVTRMHDNQDSVSSPNALGEGNDLWKKLVDELSEEEMTLYENTKYNYYYEMSKFLKNTPYTQALQYSEKKEKLEYKKIANKKINVLVSVVIPFRNRVDVTIKAIKSVENQSYKNYEIILIDDDSNEDISILVDYIKNNETIKYIKLSKNVGPAAARNIGIKESSGEYIAFLDSDDEFKKDKIKTQLHEMVKHNPYISYTSYVKKSNTMQEVIGGYGVSGVVVPRIISSCPIATPSVMIKKKILEKNNYFFNEDIRIGEDTCFWLEIAKKYEILHIDKPLTIVNIDDFSSAYDNYKFVTGLQNIITYLLKDDYYSNFSHEISLLCNDFYVASKKLNDTKYLNLKIGKYNKPNLQAYIGIYARKTIPYRLARMYKRKGLWGVMDALYKKLKKRDIKS